MTFQYSVNQQNRTDRQTDRMQYLMQHARERGYIIINRLELRTEQLCTDSVHSRL